MECDGIKNSEKHIIGTAMAKNPIRMMRRSAFGNPKINAHEQVVGNTPFFEDVRHRIGNGRIIGIALNPKVRRMKSDLEIVRTTQDNKDYKLGVHVAGTGEIRSSGQYVVVGMVDYLPSPKALPNRLILAVHQKKLVLLKR